MEFAPKGLGDGVRLEGGGVNPGTDDDLSDPKNAASAILNFLSFYYTLLGNAVISLGNLSTFEKAPPLY